MKIDFSKLEETLNLDFKNKVLFQQAFTHRSYLNENKSLNVEDNERLEFLGDAVLQLVSTEFLFRKYPEMDEGKLTTIRSILVNADNCALVAKELSFNDFLLLSKGESKETGRARQNILANTLEAVIGAIFIDQGLEKAREFINTYITSRADDVLERGDWTDAKTLFQTKAQEMEGITPVYKTLKESGPDHAKNFSVGVFLGDKKLGTGEGNSKQDAEQMAAREALKAQGWI